MRNEPELMSLFWTTAGVFPGRGEISPYDFKERVEAAARAGFRGIGIWHTDLEHILLRRSLAEMKSILDDNGIKYLELEFLTDWFLDGPGKAQSDTRRDRLLEASAALNATHVKVGDFDKSPCPLPRVTESFAALCARAEQFGARIGFELMGCAMIDNLADAVRMVKGAAAKNGGLIIDIYQMMNLGLSYAEISAIPVNYLTGVELNDGILPGHPGHDPDNRRFCGEGEYDIRGFIACVQKTGYKGPWAVEVMAEDLAGLPLDELSTRAYATTMAEFADR